MPKKRSEAVAKSRAAKGVKRRSFNLDPEADAQLQRLKGKHGSMQAVLLAGMDALETRGQNRPGKVELLQILSDILPDDPSD